MSKSSARARAPRRVPSSDPQPDPVLDVVREVGASAIKGRPAFALGAGAVPGDQLKGADVVATLCVGSTRWTQLRGCAIITMGLSREQLAILRDQCEELLRE